MDLWVNSRSLTGLCVYILGYVPMVLESSYHGFSKCLDYPTVPKEKVMGKFDDVGLYPGKYKGWMETFGGRRVNPLSVMEGDIDIISIAHSLSLICRYGGHCKVFYSVADHSIRVAEIAEPKYKLASLLHDAGESFTGDIIRPLKYNFQELIRIEDKAVRVIMEKFGIDYSNEVKEAVKMADNIMGATEGRDLMFHCEAWDKLPTPLREIIRPFSSKSAERLFLSRFNKYYKG